MISDVNGLNEALAERPRKGLEFQSGRAAVIDGNGEISGALGAPADCVRVDGSAGPCGSGAGPVFVDMEAPSGAVDGVNVVYTLTGAPSPAASLHLFRNGLLQRPGVDYSLNGTTVTFNAVATPQTGDAVVASYRR